MTFDLALHLKGQIQGQGMGTRYHPKNTSARVSKRSQAMASLTGQLINHEFCPGIRPSRSNLRSKDEVPDIVPKLRQQGTKMVSSDN